MSEGMDRIHSHPEIMNDYFEKKKTLVQLKNILKVYDNKGKRYLDTGSSMKAMKEETGKKKHQESNACCLEKWIRVIPDSTEVNLMDKCFIDSITSCLSREDSKEGDPYSRVYSFLLSMIKGLTFGSADYDNTQEAEKPIKLSPHESLLLLNLMNDLQDWTLGFQSQWSQKEKKSLSDHFWILLQERERKKTISHDVREKTRARLDQERKEDKCVAVSIDSQGNEVIREDVIRKQIVSGLNPFRVSLQISVVDREAFSNLTLSNEHQGKEVMQTEEYIGQRQEVPQETKSEQSQETEKQDDIEDEGEEMQEAELEETAFHHQIKREDNSCPTDAYITVVCGSKTESETTGKTASEGKFTRSLPSFQEAFSSFFSPYLHRM